MRDVSYAFHRELPGVELQEAVERVTAALAEAGFGVLTTIDVRATLRKKLDVEFRPYVILGACNPSLAHRALSAEDDIGLLLPCNVVVAATDDGSEVSFMRPGAMLSLASAPELEPVAEEAEGLIRQVFESL